MNRTMAALAFLLAGGLALTACGGGGHPAQAHARTASPSPPVAASSAQPGPQQFINEVRAAGLGDKDLTSASDRTLLSIGSDVCGALSAANGNGIAGYSKIITSLVKNHAHPTVRQATVWVDSAIRNLCPENSNLMPSGAP